MTERQRESVRLSARPVGSTEAAAAAYTAESERLWWWLAARPAPVGGPALLIDGYAMSHEPAVSNTTERISPVRRRKPLSTTELKQSILAHRRQLRFARKST